MKRSAAIIGPTPQFVRWAIAQPCSLREIDLDNLPESTFRQLRGIRALSEGLKENRVFEEICVHPSVSSMDHADQARGFPIAEVLEIFGGQQGLNECCNRCSANATADQSIQWAGCYGWLPADSSWNLPRAEPGPGEKRLKIEEDLPPILESIILRNLRKAFELEFGPGNPWYGLWRPRILNSGQLQVLKSALELAIELTQDAAPVRHLLDASERCLRFEIELHVELVPPGYSDGSTWVVFAHCPDCKCVVASRQECQGCRRKGSFADERKFKVLGYRPYLLLAQVLGEKDALQFVKRYLASSKMDGAC